MKPLILSRDSCKSDSEVSGLRSPESVASSPSHELWYMDARQEAQASVEWGVVEVAPSDGKTGRDGDH